MRRALAPMLVLFCTSSAAAETPSGEQIARQLNTRPRSEQGTRVATLTLIDAKGEQRERRIRSFWKLRPDARWMALFALTPPELKNHAFLAHDHFDASKDDDQWLYRPSRKRAHRVPSVRRGEAFLGSDFSFEDLKQKDRIDVGSYTWKTLGRKELAGRSLWLVEQVPLTQELARDLGYGRIVNWVDPELWLRRRIEFFDRKLAALKTFEVRDVEKQGGFWTVRRIDATNQQTGHRSVLLFSEIDTKSPVGDEIFTTRTLEAERAERLVPRRN